jgi:hypothetical protein
VRLRFERMMCEYWWLSVMYGFTSDLHDDSSLFSLLF